ncbi:MAG: hypothetical protein GF350_04885, partial [Chitinivibrionales bacterium]|nr:hypothetical protein [Chitinivibrionales bacterium]
MSGRVLDDDSIPLIGASVKLVDADLETTTGLRGKFVFGSEMFHPPEPDAPSLAPGTRLSATRRRILFQINTTRELVDIRAYNSRGGLVNLIY